MNLDNISALLDQLKDSPAWQDAVKEPATIQAPAETSATGSRTTWTSPPPGDNDDHSEAPESAANVSESPSVASLLSQLHSLDQPPPSEEEGPGSSSRQHGVPGSSAISVTPSAYHPSEDVQSLDGKESSTPTEDVRSLSYQQSLVLLANLSENKEFLQAVSKMKQDQNDMERRLWNERVSIQKKYEAKVETTKQRARLTGGTISKHEAEMISDAYKKELHKFDTERALPAWDGLITKQQESLRRIGVPTIFPTAIPADRERQQRVMRALEGVLT